MCAPMRQRPLNKSLEGQLNATGPFWDFGSVVPGGLPWAAEMPVKRFPDHTKDNQEVKLSAGKCALLMRISPSPFWRSMNIPARHCTGYLNDVGKPPTFAAGDFATRLEAWIGGRDASDAAIAGTAA
jgi:hypothetical protein